VSDGFPLDAISFPAASPAVGRRLYIDAERLKAWPETRRIPAEITRLLNPRTKEETPVVMSPEVP